MLLASCQIESIVPVFFGDELLMTIMDGLFGRLMCLNKQQRKLTFFVRMWYDRKRSVGDHSLLPVPGDGIDLESHSLTSRE